MYNNNLTNKINTTINNNDYYHYYFLLLAFVVLLYILLDFSLNIKDNKHHIFKNKYQKLLESPDDYEFNSNYLDCVEDKSTPLIECLDNFCQVNGIYQKGAIVSLSGGVDSMVLLAILIHLQKTHTFPIYSASIDYGLREESKDESKFLEKYIELFKIKGYISYVQGVSRKKENSGSRSEFEEESRILRFNTYKKIIQENNLDSELGVFVAHHQDDIVENIFTNSMRGANLLDLEVMKPISKIHGVNIYRPFLGFKKQVIYDFAHSYGIPYFLDTTPKWSKRGKMRNEIFPLLDNVFGNDWRNKLKHLGSQSGEWGNYINSFVIEPWFDRVEFGSAGIIVPIENQPKLIYSNILMKSLHQIGENMLKKTSLDKIMGLIDKKSNNIISLDGFRYATLMDDKNIIIFNKSKISKFVDPNARNFYQDLINGQFNSFNCPKNLNKLF